MSKRALVCLASALCFLGTESAFASGPKPPARACVLGEDPAGDQVLYFGDPDSTGRGAQSLDVLALKIAMTRTELQFTWSLTDLVRPVPGQSWLYYFSFSRGEAQYAVVGQVQAIAEPAGTVATDRFLVSRVGDYTTMPVEIAGRLDWAAHRMILTVTPAALGRKDFADYSLSDPAAYSAQLVGSTVGLPSDDHIAFPAGRIALGARRGC